MIFGLPWWAIVAIVGITVPLAGMFFAYKEKELKMEEKRYTSTKESQELRKMIFNLKSRIENLESVVTNQTSNQQSTGGEISLDDIEIKNDLDDSSNTSNRVRN